MGASEEAPRDAEKQNARAVAQAVLDRSNLLRDRVRRGDLATMAAHCHLGTGPVERL